MHKTVEVGAIMTKFGAFFIAHNKKCTKGHQDCDKAHQSCIFKIAKLQS